MSSDDRQSPPPVTAVVPAEKPDTAADVLAPIDTGPALAAPETLAEGLRFLQQRIPGFTHLTVKQKRSHARVANLDPEFIEAGLHAATVWEHTKHFVKRSGEELREEQEEIGRWDQVIVEMRALTDGIEAANTERKHRLGQDILLLYSMLSAWLHGDLPSHAYMRPYYENMRRAYLRTQRFTRKKKKQEEEPEKE